MLSAPFMVAAVKESLLECRPSQVSTVNDEADRACAYEARLTGCHVMTADTDLLVYNIGDAAVMWLNTLTVRGGSGPSDPLRLEMRYVKPRSLAQQWSLDNFDLVAFERSLDPKISFPEIIRRAQTPLSARHQQDLDAYEAFVQIYKPSGDMVCAFTSKEATLDPRLSEIVVMFSCPGGRNPDMYMNPLLEDPCRESAWSYGVIFRALAYSCLMQNKRPPLQCQGAVVLEHYRKGATAGDSSVCVPDLALHSADVLQMIREHEVVVYKPLPHLDECYFWRSLALRHVQQERLYRNKKLVSKDHIFKVFGLSDERGVVDWEVIHLHAIIEAVLYSLRMLKQALAVLMSPRAKKFPAHFSALAVKLNTLPEISDLHLTIAEVNEKTRCDDQGLHPVLQKLMPDVYREVCLPPESDFMVRSAST